MSRRMLLALAGTLLALGTPVRAEGFPSRPVRIVVGFSAGGPTDVPVRFIADRLSHSIGKPVYVENKPGAASMLATREVLSQPRDGHTLLACTYFDPVNTLLYRKASYAVSDIAPVTLFVKYDYGIAGKLAGPASFAELMKNAKANPGTLNYGQLGIGSSQNILAKQLEKTAGIKMVGVTFKGSADAVQEVAAGRLDLFAAPPLSVMPLVEAKQVRLLAVTGSARLPAAPDTPTLSESGVDLVAFGWMGFCAGSGTPPALIDTINVMLKPVLQSADFKSLIEKSGSTPMYTSAAEMQAVIDKTVKDAAPIIEEFKLQLD